MPKLLKPAFAACLLLCLCSVVSMAGQGRATSLQIESHVDDGAEVVGANRASIERKLAEFEEQTGYQVVLTTRLRYDSSYSIDTMAKSEFSKLAMVEGAEDNRVMLLVVTQQKRMQLEVCPALQSTINAPGALKPLDRAFIPLSRTETDGVALERAIDSIILILKPSLFSSLFSLHTTLSRIFVALLGLSITAAVGMFTKNRFQQKNSAYMKRD